MRTCCYRVQAHSVCHMTGQLTKRRGVEARKTTLFRKPADGEDGRLMSQNNHLTGSGCHSSCKCEWHSYSHSHRPFLEWPVSGRGCVDFFLPVAIHRWTGSQTKAFWFNLQGSHRVGHDWSDLAVRQRGRVPWGRLLCMDSILSVNRSKG